MKRFRQFLAFVMVMILVSTDICCYAMESDCDVNVNETTSEEIPVSEEEVSDTETEEPEEETIPEVMVPAEEIIPEVVESEEVVEPEEENTPEITVPSEEETAPEESAPAEPVSPAEPAAPEAVQEEESAETEDVLPEETTDETEISEETIEEAELTDEESEASVVEEDLLNEWGHHYPGYDDDEDNDDEEEESEFTSENEQVRVTAAASAEANLPENTEVKVGMLSKGSAEYNQAIELVKGQMGDEEHEFLDFICYDVCLEADGVEVEPEADTVKVTIEYKEPQFTDVTEEADEYEVYHIIGETEQVEKVTGDTAFNEVGAVTGVTFETGSFSFFVHAAVVELEVDDEDGRIEYDRYGILGDGTQPGISATNYFYITQNGQKHVAYCLQSLWGTPAGGTLNAWDGIEALNKGDQSLQKVLYYGYLGPADISKQFFTSSRMKKYEEVKNWKEGDFRYVMTHCAASYAYFQHYKSWAEITGKDPTDDTNPLNVATWGMSDQGKALVKEYYEWLSARVLPDTLYVNGEVGNKGETLDVFMLNGRTNTSVPIGISFTVPKGWVYKSGGQRVEGNKAAKANRQQEFSFVLSDSAQVLNPSKAPEVTITGTVNGSPDESYKIIIIPGAKSEDTGYKQDVGGISYSNLATADFNMDFSVKADAGTLTITKTDQYGKAVAGAKFCVYYDEACTRPLTAGLEDAPLATDAEGKINIGFLMTETIEATNTLYVKEMEAAEGYLLNSEVIRVTLNNGTGTVAATNTKITGTVRLQKNGQVLSSIGGGGNKVFAYDKTAGLAGAEFGLYKKNEPDTLVGTLATDSNGYAELEAIELGEYILKEIKAPAGYKLDETEHDVILTKGRAGEAVVYADFIDDSALFNQRQKLEVAIKKVDGNDASKALEGAKFGLYTAEEITAEEGSIQADTLIGTAVSDAEGNAVFSQDLPAGRYYVKELVAPTGYDLSSEVVDIDLSAPDASKEKVVFEYEYKDNELSIRVKKVDENGNMISGSELSVKAAEDIYDVDGNLLYAKGTVVVSDITDGENLLEFGETLVAGALYELAETKAPAGYAYAESVLFRIETDGTLTINGEPVQDSVIVVTDKALNLDVDKRDGADSSKEVEGAELTLYGQDAEDAYTLIIDQWVTKADAVHALGSKLEAGKSYLLKETKAPAGYAYAEDILFTVKKDGTVVTEAESVTDASGNTVYLMSDAALSLTIGKVSASDTGKMLDGAVFALYGKDEKGAYTVLVDQWVSSSKKPHDAGSKLEAGKSYLLKEVKAPVGYAYAKDVEFIVAKDGSITTAAKKIRNANGVSLYEVEDAALTLKIDKVDSYDHDRQLDGAELAVYGQDEKGEYTVVIESWTTKSNYVHELGSKLEAGRKYILRETKAPACYRLAKNIPFEVLEDGTIIIEAESRVQEDGSVVYMMIDKAISKVIEANKHKDEEENGGTFAGSKSVKTGDSAHLTLWIGLLLAALFVIVYLGRYKEKEE